MGTTSRNAIPWPANSDAPNGPLASQNIATAVDSVAVPRFATTAARDTAITSPQRGQVCYVTADQKFYFYRSAWGQANFPQTVIRDTDLSRTLTATPAIDPVLQFQARANKNYVVDFQLFISGDPAVDFVINLVVPSGATGTIFLSGADSGSTDYANTMLGHFASSSIASNQTFGTTSPPPGVLYVKGRAVVNNGATPGAVGVSWSQGTSSALATIMKTDSYLRYTEVN